jgi:hypothetical protein
MKITYKKDIFQFKRDFEVLIDSKLISKIDSGETIDIQLEEGNRSLSITNDNLEYAKMDVYQKPEAHLEITSYLRTPLTIIIFLLMILVIYLKNFQGLENGNWIMILLIMYPAYFNTIGKKYYYKIKNIK